MNDFTVILPIKGTKQEIEFMEKSIRSALDLNPGELLIPMDNPSDPYLLQKLDNITKKYEHDNPKSKVTIKRVFVDKSLEWNFQLAKIVWECYSQAKYDKIYHFDIDHTVRKTVLLGKDLLDDETVLVSFTKKLHIGSLGELIRYINYRIRTRTTKGSFSGNYWINRKLFFKIIEKEGYQKITNGIDTYLLERTKTMGVKQINRKEIGVNALSKQNEDYDWRQFEDGIWWYAHREEMMSGKIKTGMIRRSFLKRRPRLQILIKCMAYSRWDLWRGFNWARKNSQNEIVKRAKNYTRDGWTYLKTNQTLPKGIKFKDIGTGHDDY